jgi:hypothetical protein
MRRQVQIAGFDLAQLDGIQEQPGPSAQSRLAALTPPKLSGMMAIDRSQRGLW